MPAALHPSASGAPYSQSRDGLSADLYFPGTQNLSFLGSVCHNGFYDFPGSITQCFAPFLRMCVSITDNTRSSNYTGTFISVGVSTETRRRVFYFVFLPLLFSFYFIYISYLYLLSYFLLENSKLV